jgi:phenylacetate-CoA ligase
MVIQAGDIGSIVFGAIFLGSENLYEWQKALIKQAFPSAKLMTWYGHTERAIWAPWCEKSEQYHVCPFYGFTEFVGADNKEVNEGAAGELVGTSFWMQATPFIRYRTLDYAVKGPLGCRKCGRRFRIIESIEGRLQEIIVSKSGRRISMTAINVHDDTFDEVSQFRFIQNRPGELILTVMPKSSFSFESERKIVNSIGNKLGEDFVLKLVKVDEIQRTKSGKFTFLEQHLNIEHSDRVAYR